MQRLFSMFPSGSPGLALLLLRSALGILLLRAVLGPLSTLGLGGFIAAPWAVSVGLWLGLLTPVFAPLSIVVELATWVAANESPHAIDVCTILDGTLVTLLGPGAYSIDARLFGRRRIVL